jgi:hypothetical protein
MECPKCGFVRDNSSSECPRCGLIFAKVEKKSSPEPTREWKSPVTVLPDEGMRERSRVRSPVDATAHAYPRSRPFRPNTESYRATIGYAEEPVMGDDEELPPQPRHMETNDWLVLASGPVFALIIMCIPLLNHIFMTFTTLVHEMGHTFIGWIFGYPALPAFDLRYGGGVTATMPRSVLLLVVFYAVMIFLVYTYRKNRSALMFLLIFLAIHIFLSATVLHNVLFLMMGHGMELVIAAIFFYRALSGAAVLHAAERPLYCIISWFIVFSDLRFAYRLVTNAHMRRMYEEAKGGGHWMDFSRVAEDYLHTDLKVVAIFFFVATLSPLVVGFLAFRYQEYLRRVVVHMSLRDPSQPCICAAGEQSERTP